jgi:hypothetical protein
MVVSRGEGWCAALPKHFTSNPTIKNTADFAQGYPV